VLYTSATCVIPSRARHCAAISSPALPCAPAWCSSTDERVCSVRYAARPPCHPPPIHHGTPFSGGIDSGCIDDVLSSSAPSSRAEAGHTRSGRWPRAGEKRECISRGCPRGKRAPVVWAPTYPAGAHVAVCLHLLVQVACSDSDGSLCLATSHQSPASRPRLQTPTCFSFSPTPIRPCRLPRAERAGCTMYEQQPNLAEPRYTTPKV
jgi:hypothetical protein